MNVLQICPECQCLGYPHCRDKRANGGFIAAPCLKQLMDWALPQDDELLMIQAQADRLHRLLVEAPHCSNCRSHPDVACSYAVYDKRSKRLSAQLNG